MEAEIFEVGSRVTVYRSEHYASGDITILVKGMDEPRGPEYADYGMVVAMAEHLMTGSIALVEFDRKHGKVPIWLRTAVLTSGAEG